MGFCINCDSKIQRKTGRCSPCYKIWRDSTREEREKFSKERKKKWYLNNRDRILKKQSKKSYHYNKTLTREYSLKSKYGISVQKYQNMLEQCDYKCEICGKSHSEDKKLHIDHCHNSKEIRGLLCVNCNLGIGFFKDNPNFIKNALNYIKR